MLPLRYSAGSTSHHEIFIKEHIVRHQSAETPQDCTLFVLNLPPYTTEDSLKRIFSAAGPVRNVFFKTQTKNPQNGFKVAYVVFNNPQGLLKALKLKTLEPLSTTKSPIDCGIKKWVKDYNKSIIHSKVLQKEINEFMATYDKNQEEEKKQEQTAGEQDDDGWITVTKHGRNPGLSRKEVVEQKIKNKIEQSRKKKELRNFYTFQIRESKMKHLAGLRQKFEEDKKKINALKEARKFKPF